MASSSAPGQGKRPHSASDRSLTPADCAAIHWDVIVVGTGIGGATAGYELARKGNAAGRKVLFVEKGPFLHGRFAAAPDIEHAVVGGIAPSQSAATSEADEFLSQGRWPHRARAMIDNDELNFRVPVGCVSGGSSAFYAAALERFAPVDFEPGCFANEVPDSTAPTRWPVDYATLAPWYAAAEQLYKVRGTQDPLHTGAASSLLPPPPLNARDKRLTEVLSDAGLHPYRLHVACEFVPGCNGCLDGPCERNCKQDAAWASLIPALSDHGAYLFPRCEVRRLEASAERVDRVVCRHEGEELQLTASVVVLAAGAFATPALLLRSRSSQWPDGLANTSGLVGRNLMFHGGDLVAISPHETLDGEGAQKTMALNDFYHVDGAKLGTFQSLGTRLDIGQVMQYLRDSSEYNKAWWSWLLRPHPVWWRKLTSPFIRLGALVYFHAFGFSRAAVWVSIVEDLPRHTNRVYPDPDNEDDIVVEYSYSDDLKERVARFRQLLHKALGRRRLMVLSGDGKIDYPHVSGTCRFGDDPAQSVLDGNNRAHDVANLYVVDASFFPTSSGANPSLTIAANAMRVADTIHRSFGGAGE